MASPSYQAPYPVKRGDGSEIIWDWNQRDWLPYDRAAADAAKKNAPPTPAGTPDAAGAGSEGGNAGSGADAGGGGGGGDTGADPGMAERRRGSPARRRGGAPPYGAGRSLLTMRGDF